MGLRDIVKDSVDQSVVIRIIDDTDFKPENGVEHDTAGIDLWYRREGAVAVSIVEAALASLNSAHTDGGIELIGDGYYRLDLPDAAFASAADGVMVGGTLTGMIVEGAYVPLIDTQIDANVTQISGDSTAADNLESQYDTTGLSGDIFPATQSQLGQIALTGAAVSTPAKDSPDGFVITHGENEANNEDSTHAADGTYHDIEAVNDGGTEKIDVYYEFTVGGDGIPTSVTWEGYLNKGGGAGKNITVQAYNWGTTSWDQIGSISSGTTDSIETFAMFTSHVGTGANLGLVRIRFLTGSVAFSATTMLKTDQIYCSYAIVARSVGYANGRIWVDTSASNTNTETYVDGVADNPVSTWAAALTIAGNLGIDRFHLAPASSITLSANSDSYDILGYGATVDLNGQSVSGVLIEGATINGNDDGSNTLALRLRNCKLTTNTLGKARLNQCPLAGTLTLAEATTYIMEGCLSAIAGTATPGLDFGAALGNTSVNFRHYSGGIEIKNMGKAGTDTMSLEGDGQLVINSNCDPSNSPTIAIRGHFTVTDNVAGGFVTGGGTISDDARYDTTQVLDEANDALAAIKLDHLVAVADSDDPVDDSIMAKLAASDGDWSGFSEATDSLEAIRDRGDAAWTPAGSGAIEWAYTLTNSENGNPIADANIWVTSDAAGSNVLANGITDQSGVVTFWLDAGTIYIFRQKSGWNFDNPDTEVVV